MKYGRSLSDLALELERQTETKRDMIVPSTLMAHETAADGGSSVVIEQPRQGHAIYRTTDNFRRQLADKLKIPFSYFERMRSDQPDLLDRNVNTWLREEPEARMVRTLDGAARAYLSDRYRRLDNYDLLAHVLPILKEIPGARFESVELTEKRMYLKVITPQIYTEVKVGDVVQAGVLISNSEVGHGAVSVQPLVFRLVCSNGLVVPDGRMRKNHVGRIQATEEDAVTVFADDTLEADDKAFFLKVRDVTRAAVSTATLEAAAVKLRKALGIDLTGDPAKAVEAMGVRYLLNEQERSGVLRAFFVEGEMNAFGLVNAVTRFAQEVDCYDRSTELEALGGKLMELSAHDWKGIVTAA
ncbi:MAG TPA: DUF932 domain-containing protein [Burkholderiaceae bacterium]|nr:DUF932 domain-containing protein [Burkholderiaceae bacterium]